MGHKTRQALCADFRAVSRPFCTLRRFMASGCLSGVCGFRWLCPWDDSARLSSHLYSLAPAPMFRVPTTPDTEPSPGTRMNCGSGRTGGSGGTSCGA